MVLFFFLFFASPKASQYCHMGLQLAHGTAERDALLTYCVRIFMSTSSCPRLQNPLTISIMKRLILIIDFLLLFQTRVFVEANPFSLPPPPQSHLRVMLAFVGGAYRIPTSYSEVPSSMYWARLNNGRLRLPLSSLRASKSCDVVRFHAHKRTYSLIMVSPQEEQTSPAFIGQYISNFHQFIFSVSMVLFQIRNCP